MYTTFICIFIYLFVYLFILSQPSCHWVGSHRVGIPCESHHVEAQGFDSQCHGHQRCSIQTTGDVGDVQPRPVDALKPHLFAWEKNDNKTPGENFKLWRYMEVIFPYIPDLWL